MATTLKIFLVKSQLYINRDIEKIESRCKKIPLKRGKVEGKKHYCKNEKCSMNNLTKHFPSGVKAQKIFKNQIKNTWYRK